MTKLSTKWNSEIVAIENGSLPIFKSDPISLNTSKISLTLQVTCVSFARLNERSSVVILSDRAGGYVVN